MTFWTNSPTALRATWIATRAAARWSTRLSGRLAARLWFTPWRLPPSARAVAKQEAWLNEARPLQLDAGGLQVKGYEAGRGPAVLLVHGWGDSARNMGAFLSPLADAGYRAIAVDLPSHGATSGGQTDAPRIAAAIRGVANRIGPLHAVIAHSMGAHGTMVALRDGLSVERVFLLAPAVRLDSAVAPFAEMFSLPARAVTGLRAEIERRYGTNVWSEYAADRLVRDVRIPALILHDPDDHQVPFRDAQTLVRAWPSARLEEVPGVGHIGILRDPQVVARAIAFLEEKSAGSAPARALARSGA